MQLVPILIAVVLGVLALAFVLHPLYRRGSTGKEDIWQGQNGRPQDPSLPVSPGQSDSTQTDREQAARTALQEVELDYQLGNIAETDYRTLRERYVRRALVALKSRYDREQELDDAIEEQLRKLRENNGNEEK